MELVFSWWQIIIMVIALQIFGFLWYGPVWGKTWMRAMNMTESDVDGGEMKKKSFQHFILLVVKVIFIGFLLSAFSGNLFLLTVVLWGALSIPGIGMGVIWEKTPKPVALINLSAEIISLLIIAGIYSWWG